MKPAPFEYYSPRSLEHALDLVAEHGDNAKLLAGGQSLIPAMNFRMVQPKILIDLNRIDELDYMEPSDDRSLRLGSMVRQSSLERQPRVAEQVPLLAEAIPLIAHPQIRNRGTLGGSMVHADPAAELPVVAVALGATMRLASKSGIRSVSAQDFFQGMFTTDVHPDELLLDVEFPMQAPGAGWSFQEIARRPGDYAMAGLAAGVGLDDDGVCRFARMVYLNLGDAPVDAVKAAETLIGESKSDALLEAAARLAAQEEIMPFGNVHASPDYQRHLAGVLTVRALSQAWGRAQDSSG